MRKAVEHLADPLNGFRQHHPVGISLPRVRDPSLRSELPCDVTKALLLSASIAFSRIDQRGDVGDRLGRVLLARVLDRSEQSSRIVALLEPLADQAACALLGTPKLTRIVLPIRKSFAFGCSSAGAASAAEALASEHGDCDCRASRFARRSLT